MANILIMLRDPGGVDDGRRLRLHDPIHATENGSNWGPHARLGSRLRLAIPQMSLAQAQSFCVPWDKVHATVPTEPDGSPNMVPHRVRLWSFEWDLVPDNLRAKARQREDAPGWDIDTDPHFIIDTIPNDGDKTWATPSGMRQYFRNKDLDQTGKDLGIPIL